MKRIKIISETIIDGRKIYELENGEIISFDFSCSDHPGGYEFELRETDDGIEETGFVLKY